MGGGGRTDGRTYTQTDTETDTQTDGHNDNYSIENNTKLFNKLKGHCIEFKYYADGIHAGLTPPG